MKLMLITANTSVPDETSLVTKMFESGLTHLHLKKPRFTTLRMIEYLNEIPKQYHNRIIIHSHHKLALKYNLHGVYMSTTHLKAKWKYAWIKFRLRIKFDGISRSRGYRNLANASQIETTNYNYYLIGTMFNSITNSLYSGYYHDGVTSLLKNSGKNFVARGGVTPGCVKLANDYGFYGIAANSYVWKSELPYDRFLEFVEAFKSNNIPLD